ncbi:related to methyltransferase [Cephalotrichum gorgonifer]|uniref:Related to methyltransferase n=1 Tax=Cephalotrichum gorgonifer TaxID=2041049 RepID=A0AAE8N3K1_9PEZI|nr:related to methyltransferase [Cephalotrichum gorgonifer]
MTGESASVTTPVVGAKSEPTLPRSGPSSPNSKSVSPKEGSPEETTTGILPAQHWVEAAQDEEIDNSDAESAMGSLASSTASLTASILEYRKIHGRTYHSEIGNASYWGANDEQQNEAMDMYHHLFTLALDGKLFLAPLDAKNIHKVVDIGTGTGSWAIDFADDHPNVEVIGTDISPIQSTWVPTNLKFEMDDCTLDWTFSPNSLDYVHMRLLVGSIKDWEALFREAYKALTPGGWLESHECNAVYECDDDSVQETSALGQWGKLFAEFGRSIGRSFTVLPDGIQRKAMEAAGFVEISEADFKTPIGSWPKDPQLKEIGQYAQHVVEADTEGYILYPATALGWSREEVTVFAAHVRRELYSPKTHPWYRQKVVLGRKPLVA